MYEATAVCKYGADGELSKASTLVGIGMWCLIERLMLKIECLFYGHKAFLLGTNIKDALINFPELAIFCLT